METAPTPRTEEAMQKINTFYTQKVETDYDKIIEMIENGGPDLTRKDFLVGLGITDEVLDAFFDLVHRGCEGDERDRICDRLIQINKDDLARIVKKLKNETIRLEEKKGELDAEVQDLRVQIEEKDQIIADLQKNNSGDVDTVIAERNELADKVDELNRRISDLESSNANLQETIQRLEYEKTDMESRCNELNEALSSRDQRILELEANYSSQSYGDNSYNADESAFGYGNESNDYDELQRDLEAIRAERDDLLYRLQSYSQNDTDVYGNDGFGSQSTDYEAEIAEKEQRIRDLEYQLSAKEEELRALRDENYRLQQSVRDLEERTVQQQEGLGTDYVPQTDEPEDASGLIFPEYDEEEKPVKKKSKTGLYVLIGIFMTILLALVGLVAFNTNTGPVAGTPTPIPESEKTTGEGLSANVANGAATQIAPSAPAALPTAPVQENIPTPLDPVQAQTPTASGQLLLPLLQSPYDFRKHQALLKVTEQGLMIDGRAYKVGETVNGFRILMINKTFVRFNDPKNGDLEFRIDIGA